MPELPELPDGETGFDGEPPQMPDGDFPFDASQMPELPDGESGFGGKQRGDRFPQGEQPQAPAEDTAEPATVSPTTLLPAGGALLVLLAGILVAVNVKH